MSQVAVKQLPKSKIELFRLNQMYFEEHRAELLRKFKSKFVAIWDRRVVGFDEDKIRLAKRVYKEVAYLPIYIQKVQKAILKVKIPSNLTYAAKSTFGT